MLSLWLSDKAHPDCQTILAVLCGFSQVLQLSPACKALVPAIA